MPSSSRSTPAPREHSQAATKLGIPGVIEWTHGNSLVYLPADRRVLPARAATPDWLLKIDATDRRRDLAAQRLRRVPGRLHAARRRRCGATPHLSDLWDGGALVFDNGDHYVPDEDPRVVEVGWDETAMTARHRSTIDRPRAAIAAAMGDARRMPDDRIAHRVGRICPTSRSTLPWRAISSGSRTIPSGLYAAQDPIHSTICTCCPMTA